MHGIQSKHCWHFASNGSEMYKLSLEPNMTMMTHEPLSAVAVHADPTTGPARPICSPPITPLSFVVVCLLPDGKKKMPVFFVGHVLHAEPAKMWRIRCMRRHRFGQFVFPTHDDIDTYCHDEIVRVLSIPKIIRGIHHFPDDFSDYASAMR
jgi:hypothetical protein